LSDILQHILTLDMFRTQPETRRVLDTRSHIR